WDQVARPHEWQASKNREYARSWPVLMNGPAARSCRSFIGPARWVKAPVQTSSTVLALLEGALGRIGRAAGRRRAVERHALDAAPEQGSLLRGQRARVDPHPGDFRGQASVLDLRTAVHHHFQAGGFRAARGLVIADAELHPDRLRAWLQRER